MIITAAADRIALAGRQTHCIVFIIIISDDTGKLLYYKNKGELLPEGEIIITHATFSFDAKLKPGVFEIRYNISLHVSSCILIMY